MCVAMQKNLWQGMKRRALLQGDSGLHSGVPLYAMHGPAKCGTPSAWQNVARLPSFRCAAANSKLVVAAGKGLRAAGATLSSAISNGQG